MRTNDQFIKSVFETILRTYPENDPRARARRFFPAFAKIGYCLAGLTLLSGAFLLSKTTFPLHSLVCMIYGMLILPTLGLSGFYVSRLLYQTTVMVLAFKDRRATRGGPSDSLPPTEMAG